ncbi:MAG: Sip1-related alpha-galactosidase [Cyclobacteriaceae bacterium]
MVHEGTTRIIGFKPAFESVDFKTEDRSVAKSDFGYEVSFSSNSNKPVSVKAHLMGSNTLCFSMSPNGNHSVKGGDYLGFLFDLIPGYSEGIAAYLFGDWKAWTKPLQVKDYKKTREKDLLFFLWQYEDGMYGAAIPLAGKGYGASLGTEGDSFGVKAYNYLNDSNEKDIPLLAITFGENPYQVVKELYQSGMTFMGKEKNLRVNKAYPEMFEKIGWCTWNAIGEDINESKLMDAVSTFTANGFRLPWLLIDDGWLHITDSLKLVSLKADKRKFKYGLKPVVENLKKEHGIEDIGLWHTINGYWNGIDPKSDLAKGIGENISSYKDKYNVHHESLSKDTYWSPSVEKGVGLRFYEEWYTYLKKEGLTFLKVDQQCVIPRIAKGQRGEQRLPYWNIAENMEAHLQQSADKYFDRKIINCMDMALEATYNFGSTPIARSSDDFFPTRTAYFSHEIEKGNAAAHTLANVHNSLWYSQMVWPDFDMFQTHHVSAEYHAVTRAISGGPVYITDETGKQNFKILNKLTYHDGSILRADIPARPTRDCLFQINELKPFKAFTLSGTGGLLAAYNAVDADQVEGTFKPADVEGIEGDRFAVYEHFSGELVLADRHKELPITIDRLTCQLYSIVPVTQIGVALIGLSNKYNSPKTILKQQITADRISFNLKESGELVAYSERFPERIEVDGVTLRENNWKFENAILSVTIPERSSTHNIDISIQF